MTGYEVSQSHSSPKGLEHQCLACRPLVLDMQVPVAHPVSLARTWKRTVSLIAAAEQRSEVVSGLIFDTSCAKPISVWEAMEIYATFRNIASMRFQINFDCLIRRQRDKHLFTSTAHVINEMSLLW